jgi:Uma2 family endonuclease
LDSAKFADVPAASGYLGGGDYAPDAFVVSAHRWDALTDAEIDGVVWIPVLPTAVFELLSASNKTADGYTREFQLKLDDCERSAVPLVALLDPDTETTIVRRPGHAQERFTMPTVTFTDLPGLELDVATIFAACKVTRKRRL